MKTTSTVSDQVIVVLHSLMQDRQMEVVDLEETTVLTEVMDLESIDYVVMVERLHTTFDNQIDFTDWLSTLDPTEIAELTVGNIVDFIVNDNRGNTNVGCQG